MKSGTVEKLIGSRYSPTKWVKIKKVPFKTMQPKETKVGVERYIKFGEKATRKGVGMWTMRNSPGDLSPLLTICSRWG